MTDRLEELMNAAANTTPADLPREVYEWMEAVTRELRVLSKALASLTCPENAS